MSATGLPPDLEPAEREIAATIGQLESLDPPAELRERVLGAVAASRAAGSVVPGILPTFLAAAAAILAAVGLFSFAQAAGRVDQGDLSAGLSDPSGVDRPAMAVVDDPLMPIFSSLEPIGSLGPYDEVIADAGR